MKTIKCLPGALAVAVPIFFAGYWMGNHARSAPAEVKPIASPNFSDGVTYGSVSVILMVHRGQSPTWPILEANASNAWYAVNVAHSMTWEGLVAQTEDLALSRAVQ